MVWEISVSREATAEQPAHSFSESSDWRMTGSSGFMWGKGGTSGDGRYPPVTGIVFVVVVDLNCTGDKIEQELVLDRNGEMRSIFGLSHLNGGAF